MCDPGIRESADSVAAVVSESCREHSVGTTGRDSGAGIGRGDGINGTALWRISRSRSGLIGWRSHSAISQHLRSCSGDCSRSSSACNCITRFWCWTMHLRIELLIVLLLLVQLVLLADGGSRAAAVNAVTASSALSAAAVANVAGGNSLGAAFEFDVVADSIAAVASGSDNGSCGDHAGSGSMTGNGNGAGTNESSRWQVLTSRSR